MILILLHDVLNTSDETSLFVQKLLSIPGMLTAQLRASTATKEDLIQYPARISKEGNQCPIHC
jgi:hypothetical protein